MTVEEYRIAQLYMIQVSPERWLDQVKLDGFQCTLVGTVHVCEVLHLGILGSRGIRVSCHHYTPAPILISSLRLPSITLHPLLFQVSAQTAFTNYPALWLKHQGLFLAALKAAS